MLTHASDTTLWLGCSSHQLHFLQPWAHAPVVDAEHVPLLQAHVPLAQQTEALLPFVAQQVLGGQHCTLEPEPQFFDPATAVLGHAAALRG